MKKVRHEKKLLLIINSAYGLLDFFLIQLINTFLYINIKVLGKEHSSLSSFFLFVILSQIWKIYIEMQVTFYKIALDVTAEGLSDYLSSKFFILKEF